MVLKMKKIYYYFSFHFLIQTYAGLDTAFCTIRDW